MKIITLCRSDQPTKKGELPIIFRVNNKKISTGEAVPDGSWNPEKSKIRHNFAKAVLIEKRLARKKEALHSIIDALPSFDIDTIRSLFKKYLDDPEQLDAILAMPLVGGNAGEFYQLIELVLHERRTTWAPKYAGRFRTLRNKILEYDLEFTLKKLTVAWWREFVNYCVEELENTNNTINSDAKLIQSLIKIFRSKGYKLPNNLDEIEQKYIEPEVMSLEWSQVLAIKNLNLSKPEKRSMPKSRDLWLVGAFTGRRSDEIRRMTKHNFYQDKEGRWRYKNIAKGKKPVDIPLLPEAVEHLKKMKFEFPRLDQSTVNTDIKKIAKAAGINKKVLWTRVVGNEIKDEIVEEWETVHIHTGRHSYAMHIVDMSAGKPHAEKLISFLLGHASHNTTWKYLNRRASSHDLMFDAILKDHKS